MARNIISFAGAGRVAGALCMEFYCAGIKIQKIVSEFEEHGISLANRCNATWSSELIFPDSTDIIIVAVPDHKLKEILGRIDCPEHTMVAHTAGSYGLEVFPGRLKRTGVLYPLQTFSKERKVDFSNLPFFVETSDKDFSDILKELVGSIGGNVHFVDTQRRKMLHLSAVFVCNFVNHMLMAGNEIASRAGFSLEVLKPLITETVSKAMDLAPKDLRQVLLLEMI